MEKNSKFRKHSSFLQKVAEEAKKGKIPEKFQAILVSFYNSYGKALEEDGLSIETCTSYFEEFLNLIEQQFSNPFSFAPYHKAIRSPFDYYLFGVNFLRPLVNKAKSVLLGSQYLEEISKIIKRKENVVLLANHQTEADPQAISILLEDSHSEIGEQMIFVAGERVVTDPLAIPISMGTSLLCIYSKRYIDSPPEQKMQKQLHNKRTMELMSSLLSEGGKCIYVAPSGGRDRANAEGVVEVASFDPQSIEMFYLMSQKAKKKTHFFTLALATYDLLPPPQTIQIELGEERIAKRGGIGLAFGKEIDMENYPNFDHPNKYERRKGRAEYIWQQVKKDYAACKGALV